MRLMRFSLGLVACGCLAVTPAFAGQRGAHPVPTTGIAHPVAPAHPVGPAHPVKPDAHPAPVPVPQRIATNPALATRLQPLLPSGMTLAAAATGFRNQGQFIAALHVSRNLNIPFAQLKAEMTGSDHDSLGRAIHDLRPSTNAKAAVKTAEQQARADLKSTKLAKPERDKGDR